MLVLECFVNIFVSYLDFMFFVLVEKVCVMGLSIFYDY